MKAKKRQRATIGERLEWIHAPGLRVAAAAVLSIAGLGAVAWGAMAVHTRAERILASEPIQIDIEWPRLPGADRTWLGEGLRARIVARVETALAGRALDADALDAVGQTLDSSGWFDGPPNVARTGDATLRVSGDWRAPACAVTVRGRDYPVDWQGRPLPVDYAAGTSGLRSIVGVGAGVPLDAHGTLIVHQPWPGEDVSAALELLEPLLREPYAAQVAGIDVRAFYTHNRLSIVTDTDSRVVWGGRFGAFTPGEATTEQKLSRLRAAAANPMYQRRIDSGVQRLDISGEHLILDRTGTP